MTSSNARPDILLAATLSTYLTECLATHFNCHVLQQLSASELAAIAPKIRAMACKGDSPITPALMAQFSALELIAVFGVGYDGIDVSAAQERGIHVTHTPDVLNDDVVDLAMGLLLNTARQLPQAERFARSGQWPQAPFKLTTKVSGARMGIVGLGRIGLAIATRASAFGMHISYHNRSPRSDVSYRYVADLKTLASEVDFLVLSMPGGKDTRMLINAEVLEALGPQGYLINVARGSVVDEAALISALEQGRIAGAGLDVFAHEPHIPAALTALDNVVMTPHIASGTVATRTAMADLVVRNLLAHFNGQPLLTPVPSSSK